jgi:cell division protein FtsL
MRRKQATRQQTEFIPPRQEVRESKRITMKELLGGGVLSREVVLKQIPFVLFLFALILLYIANQYRGDKVMTEVFKLDKRVKELRTESVSTAFELMEKSKQTQVIKLIESQGLGLEEAVIPPYKIIVEE